MNSLAAAPRKSYPNGLFPGWPRFVSERALVVFFGVLGFLAPLVYGSTAGLPKPQTQDEMSYTVAADTYARGRLTNPTPAFSEHFEAPHVLMEPSYISKYPPLQGLFLAAGLIVFGEMIYGVWLSCGLFAAALCWMLLGWTRPAWAAAGTALAILLVGLESYWAQSYWGGMIAAAGGALFFGGFRRLFPQLSAGAAALMTLGGVVLVNSRPFEGAVTMLPALLVLLVHLLRDRKSSLARKFGRVVLPGLVVAALGLGAMGYQYYRVTGDASTLPYAVHHAQYYPTPLFGFQAYNPAATRGNERVRQIYERYVEPDILRVMLMAGLPDAPALRSVYGFFYLHAALPFFLFSPVLLLVYFCALPLVLRRAPPLRLVAATMLFTFLVMAAGVWWDQYHYAAPLASCFFLLLAEGLRQFYQAQRTSALRRRALVFFAILVATAFLFQRFGAYRMPRMETDFAAERKILAAALESGAPAEIKVPTRAAFFKDEFERMLDRADENYLALVRYEADFNYHDEIVYNRADLDAARIVWAHDLGDEKNRALAAHYAGRKILLVRVRSDRIRLETLR